MLNVAIRPGSSLKAKGIVKTTLRHQSMRLTTVLGSRGDIQDVEHTEGHGGKMFVAVCDLDLEGIVSKNLDAPYRPGKSQAWIKVKNPKSPAATRAIDGTF